MQDSSSRRKKIVRSVIFLAGLLGLLLWMSHQITDFTKKNGDMIQGRNKSIVEIQKEPENTIDVLVVGDSESYTSVSPLEMWKNQGVASFICGQSGQKIQETYYMLKTALTHQSPKLVLLETNVLFRNMKGVKGIQEEVIQKADYYFPIFRFHDIWKNMLLGRKYTEERYKGFTLRDMVQSYDGGQYMKETTEKDQITQDMENYTDKILELCREHNARVMFYSAPSPLNYSYRKHNAIQELADKKQLLYLDLNLHTEELSIDWKVDSMDKGDHLNLSGANKVTQYLGAYIQKRYELPDHRGEAAYQSWQKDAASYVEQAQKRIMLIQDRGNSGK